jgi:hypothetical protein
MVRVLASAGTTTAPTMQTFNIFALFKFVLRNTTYACGVEVVVARLNASEAAQALIPGLLPLGNQCCISVLFVEAPLIELARDLFFPVVHVENVSAALMMEAEDGPHGFSLALALVRFILCIFHFLGQLSEGGLNQIPSLRGLLPGCSHPRHCKS